MNLSAYEVSPPFEWPMGAVHPELVQASLLPLPSTPLPRPMDGLSAYELWPGYIRRPRVRLIRRGWPLYGFGAEVEPTSPAPAPALPETPQQVAPLGKGLFLGTAYGIAIGMIASEFVMRKADASAQLKQNHQLILYGALFGAAAGMFGAVQA